LIKRIRFNSVVKFIESHIYETKLLKETASSSATKISDNFNYEDVQMAMSKQALNMREDFFQVSKKYQKIIE